MDWTHTLLDRRRFGWVPVRTGESGDLVYRRADGLAFAKIARPARAAELAGERDRLAWLHGRGVGCPEVIDWRDVEAGACLLMTAVPGVPATRLPGTDLLKAWPSMAQQLGRLHALATDSCPFDRNLLVMVEQAAAVVARAAVNPDFLPDEDQDTRPGDLLARVERDLPARLDQEAADRVVCHGDACMPNFMVDPASFQCTGLVDLGRLGTADRYVDLALMAATAHERWASQAVEAEAFAILFQTVGIEAPDRERLDFYLRLDPLTWG